MTLFDDQPPPALPPGADWLALAYAAAVEFVRDRRQTAPGVPFTTAQMAAWCEKHRGLPRPAEPRSWGPIPGYLDRDGLVTWAGNAKAKSALGNAKPQNLWRVVV